MDSGCLSLTYVHCDSMEEVNGNLIWFYHFKDLKLLFLNLMLLSQSLSNVCSQSALPSRACRHYHHTWIKQSLKSLNVSSFLIRWIFQRLHERNRKMSKVYICNYSKENKNGKGHYQLSTSSANTLKPV